VLVGLNISFLEEVQCEKTAVRDGGSVALERTGHRVPAVALLLILACPGFGFALFLHATIVLHRRWT
jgi:hypothetical protein